MSTAEELATLITTSAEANETLTSALNNTNGPINYLDQTLHAAREVNNQLLTNALANGYRSIIAAHEAIDARLEEAITTNSNILTQISTANTSTNTILASINDSYAHVQSTQN